MGKFMKIYVQVKVNRKKEGVEKKEDGSLLVWTKEPAQEGRANEDVIRQVASYYNIPKSSVELLIGHKNKIKVFEVGN